MINGIKNRKTGSLVKAIRAVLPYQVVRGLHIVPLVVSK